MKCGHTSCDFEETIEFSGKSVWTLAVERWNAERCGHVIIKQEDNL